MVKPKPKLKKSERVEEAGGSRGRTASYNSEGVPRSVKVLRSATGMRNKDAGDGETKATSAFYVIIFI